MKNLSLLSLLLTLLFQSQAQKLNGIVRGSLKDSATTQALSDATVSIVHTRDSALVSFTLSAKGGNFELKNLAPGSYFLLVHHQGYRLFRKSFSITESAPVFDVGQVRLSQEFKTMREVVVNDYTPIKVKGDTITYYANAFPLSRPNATAEELLKRLPGIIVEKNGIIKAHGENVQKVYVDGKEFFNNDPKLATRNLNADMIERVEVYDDLSEQAKFSGIDDGSRSKAINLKLKKEKKQGVFGRASVGSGTDNRYEAGLTANYFKGASKLSVVARTNNINNLGSTANDQVGIPSSNNFSNNSSLGSALVGSAPGINNNSTTGVNYSDLWGKNTEITTSYYFNNLTNINNSKSFRQSFFPDSIFRSQEADVESNNQSHRINVRVVQAIDSSSSIIYAPAISFQNTETNRQDSSETHLMAGKYLTPLNDSRTIREQRGAGTFLTNNLTYRKRFAKGGRTFSITLTNTNNNMQKSGQTDARMGRYVNGSKASDSLIRQKNSIHHQASSRGASISYTEPVAPDKFVEINYQHTYDGNLSDREALDWNSNNSKYDLINPQQSNNFKNANVSDRIGSNFRVVKKKYNYQLGLAAQSITLQSRDLTKDSTIEQTFTNLFPAATLNYQFARSKSLRIQYRGRTDQPNISQLQPIRDV
ncbi:MAG TPA: TonB-dependent receptor, partial [Chitinophagaceae bacterium]|nr:TonB-dependent receptor [Chitinophagaceae bacterium]